MKRLFFVACIFVCCLSFAQNNSTIQLSTSSQSVQLENFTISINTDVGIDNMVEVTISGQQIDGTPIVRKMVLNNVIINSPKSKRKLKRAARKTKKEAPIKPNKALWLLSSPTYTGPLNIGMGY